MDFKDGNGYQAVPLGGVVTKVYADSSSLKPVDFKAQLSSGAYLYCHSTLDVKVTLSTTSNANARYAGSDPYAREVSISAVSGENWGDDKLQIRYSQNNPTRTGSAPRLLKPLIYVEGYDVENDYDIMDLIRNDVNKPGEWLELFTNTGYDFMHDLDDVSGYDLVFVNYNTLRSFTQNTLMLQRVIEWVKADKTAGGSSAKNVVIGTSAGGVLSRYTLARMTKQVSAASTDTRLLITHDSPHQGANVPLAFQHFLFDLGECQVLGNKIKDNFEDLRKFYELNNAPATAELLKARVVEADDPVAINTFLNGDNSPYQQMVRFVPADNQPDYRFIATAQGSQCGIPVMPSNGLGLADADGPFAIARINLLWVPTPWRAKYDLKTQLNALPAANTVSQIEYFKYTRRVSFWGVGFGTKTLRERIRSNPAGYTEWDAAPGSTQSINGRTGGALSEGLERQKVGFIKSAFVWIRAGLDMNVTNDLFSFVPTVSALDAPSGTPLNQPYIFPVTGTSVTRTQKYIAQKSFVSGGITYYNQNHTDFTATNAEWIYKEMQDQSTSDLSCSVECGSTIYKVEGANIVCSTGVYKVVIAGVDFGGTVNWSASPSASVSFSCTTCPSPTITRIGSGNVTLTATITDPCNNTVSQTTQKTISLGEGAISGTYNSPTNSAEPLMTSPPGGLLAVNPSCVAFTTNMSVPLDATVSWSGTTSPGVTWNYSGKDIFVNFTELDQEATLTMYVTTSCGTSYINYLFKCTSLSSCGVSPLRVALSPNPSNGEAQVSLKDKKEKKKDIKEVRVLDKLGNLQQRMVYGKGVQTVRLNLAHLPTDVYTILVFDGKTWTTTKLSKK